MNDKLIPRRDFMKMAAAGTAVTTIALNSKSISWLTSSEPEPTTEGPTHSWAMVIDLDKCTSCGNCSKACQAHNDTAPDMAWNRLIPAGTVNGEDLFVPVPCMHCENPPCVGVCPVQATYKRADGIVMMDYDRCIGCRYCQLSCPYGARSFNWQEHTAVNPVTPEWGEPEIERRPRGVVEKCTFCVHRIDRGVAEGLTPGVDPQATPACVATCPVGARIFGDLNDPDSNVSKVLANHQSVQLRRDLGTKPRVYYLPAGSTRQTS
jgi:Fe-S-cluster-containing dehydrogenase component